MSGAAEGVICRACGQSALWCSVYTGCPLNKGKNHDLKQKRSENEGEKQRHLGEIAMVNQHK